MRNGVTVAGGPVQRERLENDICRPEIVGQRRDERVMKKTLILLATVMCAIHSGLADDAPAADRYIFAKSGLSIPKQIETLRFVGDREHQPDGVDTQLSYRDASGWINVSLYVYQSPPGTKGPFLMLDSDGKKVLEDREEMIKRHNALYKLTQPSESYLEEYRLTLDSIYKNQGYELKTEFRFMAVPTRDDTPIAYAAILAKTDQIEGQDVRMKWKTYLYCIPGYFVKMHCTYPEQLTLEVALIDAKFIQSINWSALLPKRPK